MPVTTVIAKQTRQRVDRHTVGSNQTMMIDIHSHILPNVDDGAKSVEDALKMLRIAAQDGVTHQVLTPHIQTNRFDNNITQLTVHFEVFQKAAAAEEIPIKLHLAAEVHIGPEIIAMVSQNSLPWLGTWNKQQCFLLELPPNHIPADTPNLLRWLRARQIVPIIVHPERNQAFQENPDKLQPFLSAGCPIQITSSSISGDFGKRAKQLAIDLLHEGKVDMIATDCHNLKYRPPNLSNGIDAAGHIIGHSQAQQLANPTALELL